MDDNGMCSAEAALADGVRRSGDGRPGMIWIGLMAVLVAIACIEICTRRGLRACDRQLAEIERFRPKRGWGLSYFDCEEGQPWVDGLWWNPGFKVVDPDPVTDPGDPEETARLRKDLTEQKRGALVDLARGCRHAAMSAAIGALLAIVACEAARDAGTKIALLSLAALAIFAAAWRIGVCLPPFLMARTLLAEAPETVEAHETESLDWIDERASIGLMDDDDGMPLVEPAAASIPARPGLLHRLAGAWKAHGIAGRTFAVLFATAGILLVAMGAFCLAAGIAFALDQGIWQLSDGNQGYWMAALGMGWALAAWLAFAMAARALAATERPRLRRTWEPDRRLDGLRLGKPNGAVWYAPVSESMVMASGWDGGGAAMDGDWTDAPARRLRFDCYAGFPCGLMPDEPAVQALTFDLGGDGRLLAVGGEPVRAAIMVDVSAAMPMQRGVTLRAVLLDTMMLMWEPGALEPAVVPMHGGGLGLRMRPSRCWMVPYAMMRGAYLSDDRAGGIGPNGIGIGATGARGDGHTYGRHAKATAEFTVDGFQPVDERGRIVQMRSSSSGRRFFRISLRMSIPNAEMTGRR